MQINQFPLLLSLIIWYWKHESWVKKRIRRGRYWDSWKSLSLKHYRNYEKCTLSTSIKEIYEISSLDNPQHNSATMASFNRKLIMMLFGIPSFGTHFFCIYLSNNFVCYTFTLCIVLDCILIFLECLLRRRSFM